MIKTLTSIPAILLSYLAVIMAKSIYAIFFTAGNAYPYWLVPLAFLIYCSLSYLAYRRNKVALWIMILVIFTSGTGGLILGIVFIPISQAVLKAAFVALGVYFLYGAYKLYESRHTEKTA